MCLSLSLCATLWNLFFLKLKMFHNEKKEKKVLNFLHNFLSMIQAHEKKTHSPDLHVDQSGIDCLWIYIYIYISVKSLLIKLNCKEAKKKSDSLDSMNIEKWKSFEYIDSGTSFIISIMFYWLLLTKRIIFNLLLGILTYFVVANTIKLYLCVRVFSYVVSIWMLTEKKNDSECWNVKCIDILVRTIR